ncbi:hypothetical protein SBBP2_230023 [Burkholderiales bacterium]|jgi:hypothetical protein|nr:hypothetical protein SBBP2_230023 [Burkholderiales bacterium]
MEKTDDQRELDAVRHIVQIRVVMNRHDLTFEQAAAVLHLSALHEVLRAVARDRDQSASLVNEYAQTAPNKS